jgi:hypothetical protein
LAPCYLIGCSSARISRLKTNDAAAGIKFPSLDRSIGRNGTGDAEKTETARDTKSVEFVGEGNPQRA